MTALRTAFRPSALRGVAAANPIRRITTPTKDTFVRTKATLPDLACMYNITGV